MIVSKYRTLEYIKANLIYIILFFSVINILSTFLEKQVFGDLGILGDATLYYCAATKFKLGVNPYDFANCFGETTMHYQYSLIALIFFYILNFLNLENYKIIWLIFELISLVTICIYSIKIFKFKKKFFSSILILFAFGGACWSGILSGNISIILYAIISIGIFKLYQEKFIQFGLLMILGSFFIPYLLIFLILGFGLYKFKFLKPFILTILITLIIQFLSYLIEPELFKNYLNVIFYSTSNEYYKDLGSGIGIIGMFDGLINLTKIEMTNLNISKILWLLISIFISFFYIFNSQKDKETNIAIGILVTTLLNPYLMNYDLYLIIPSILFLTYKVNFFDKLDYNNKFAISLLILMIVLYDKFSALFLTNLILFFILKDFYFKKSFKNI